MHRDQIVVLCRDQNVDLFRVHGKEGPKYGPMIRDQYLVPILRPTFGPYSGTTLGVQILVPYMDHRMCGPLRTLIGPWVRRSKIFWDQFWDHIDMVPIEGPKNGPIIWDQILVPILGPHSGP